MRHPDFEYRMMMEHQRDMLAEAANGRLVKEAREAERQNSGAPALAAPLLARAAQAVGLLIGRGLYWFGERIQVWGCRLQYRYAMSEMRGEPAPCK